VSGQQLDNADLASGMLVDFRLDNIYDIYDIEDPQINSESHLEQMIGRDVEDGDG
jgi:hypothetical protein